MRIALFGKMLSADNQVFMTTLMSDLTRSDVGLSIYKPFLPQIMTCLPEGCCYDVFETYDDLKSKADVVISIGGDGTILDAVPLLRDSGVPILGINMGRLGFLSSVSKNEIDNAVEKVVHGNFHVEKRTLLQLVSPANLFPNGNCALNELSVIRSPEHSLLAIKVFIDEVYLNTYWGDGILLATPTGSTAYSLSAGGPIMAPNSSCFVITPIAAHNLTVRPIVIPDESTVRIMVEGRDNSFVFGMDSTTRTLDTSVELVIRKADFCINMLRMDNEDFFGTIRNKLMWGKDNRN